jgi:uncharacterized membrane protein YfcA
MASSIVRVVLFGAAGLLSQSGLVVTALWLAPAMIAGLFIGNRLHAAVPTGAVVRVVYLLMAVAGVSLLIRAASS